MVVSAEASTLHRVHCRQIVENDLDALAALYAMGFPNTARSFWDQGLAYMTALPQIEGMPRFGYVLESDAGMVGALLTISSRRGAQIVTNVSAWYVRPDYRAHSIMLVSVATKRKDVIYLNASPISHSRHSLQRIGWAPCNLGRTVIFTAFDPGSGKVHRSIPAELPAHERKILEDHRGWNGISVVCEKEGALSPFVFKPYRISRFRIPVMELIYCRSTADFERCSGALGRHFLLRGHAGFLLDGNIRGPIVRYIPGKEFRLYKGARAPEPNDFAYTEKLIFP